MPCFALSPCMINVFMFAPFLYVTSLPPPPLPPQHVSLRRANGKATRRQLHYTSQEGEVDQRTVSVFVCVCMTGVNDMCTQYVHSQNTGSWHTFDNSRIHNVIILFRKGPQKRYSLHKRTVITVFCCGLKVYKTVLLVYICFPSTLLYATSF